MKIDEINKELQQKIVKMLDDAKPEEKSEAIYEAAAMIAAEKHKGLIEELTRQNAQAAADEDYRKALGLRKLSKEEETFYERFKDIKQSITASQIDIIPTSIIDRTLDDIKKKSDILSLVAFAPADVKKWIVASHSGKAVWGGITDAITGELSAEISALNIEQHKMTAFIIIPKSIRDLALPFVDRYFMAVMEEALQDGFISGYLKGDGKTGPIGIMNKIESFKTDGTAAAKTVIQTVKKFSPKGLAEVRKTLSNDGKRVITELHLICNPMDEAEYVDPALYGEALTGGYKDTSFMPIKKHPEANCPKGKAIFTIPNAYVMGATAFRIDEYKETKAMDDMDLVIGKCYANGRAIDDNCAVVFDVTKLEEYVLPVTQVTNGQPAEA
ncbi:phage major capsid protein [[Clostridium] scindens]|uniref:phage major capsid protein n=1 Tax=Clostridium scindens (strain JCM 10418 / VPI 12708) TaxID=29347 RepID=UPI002E79DD23|nr:phage major capsid protein [[Clostridium] scindens]MEE0650153.1 phage major capsid protein [[Clostridium] scindens]